MQRHFFWRKKLYPFQISVDYAEVMHILQTVRNINQLNSTLVRLLRGQAATYELSAVGVPIPLDELVDIPILHPLRNQSESVFTHRHPKEWQDVGMPEVFPSNTLSAESLGFVHSGVRDGADKILTPRMISRSLVMYTRITLIAT